MMTIRQESGQRCSSSYLLRPRRRPPCLAGRLGGVALDGRDRKRGKAPPLVIFVVIRELGRLRRNVDAPHHVLSALDRGLRRGRHRPRAGRKGRRGRGAERPVVVRRVVVVRSRRSSRPFCGRTELDDVARRREVAKATRRAAVVAEREAEGTVGLGVLIAGHGAGV